MDLLENPKLPIILRLLNTNDFKKFNTFMWNGFHINAVLCYILKSRSNYDNGIHILDRLEASRDTSRFPRMVLSFTENLREFLTFPKLQLSNNSRNYNEILASFLDFLLHIVEQIVKFHANLIDQIEDQIEVLQKELKFLIAILGDEPFRCIKLEKTNNFMKYMEAVANEIGCFLYLFFFTDEGMQSRIDLSLSRLIKKFDPTEAKIKEFCITVSKKPSCVVPKTAVGSLFILDSLLNDLDHLMNREDDFIFDVLDEIMALQEELLLSRSFLECLKEHQHVKLAQQIRDVAYEAEYLINSFLAGDVPSWYLNLRFPDVIQKIKIIMVGFEEIKKLYDAKYIINSFVVGDVPIWYLTLRFPDVIEKVVDLQAGSKIKNIFDAGAKINARDPSEKVEVLTTEITVVDDIVGFKDEVTQIADQLTSGPKWLQIISIFGMPGLGKTTLAKKLYNDSTVVDHFDCSAWCVVSHTYRKKNLLIELLSCVSDVEHDKMVSLDTENLGVELHKSLLGRRYLIVMDDVWNSYEWDDMKKYLPDDRNGSRILLTSRHKHVAPSYSIIYPLPFLSDDQCWDLLQQKVFQKDIWPQELVDIGKKIAVHCQGLPLAVVVIAAVLANMNKKKSLWSEVAGSLSSQISKDPNKCMNILELSYKHLPAHLKPCFLYFGAFPEDEEISVRKLISLWVAEGFIQKEEQKSLNHVAEDYLMEIINRGLVLVAKRRSRGGVKSCRIHDLLRDLCLRKAKEENFLNLIKDQFSLYEQHHRLCIPNESASSESRPFGLHVRSWLGPWSEVSFTYSRLKLLRVLDLLFVEHPEEFPSKEDLDLTGIEQLVHLRYLAARVTADRIPPSIGSLHKLEFLLFDGTGSVEIPAEALLKLVKLRDLHVRKNATFNESWHSPAILENGLQMISMESISNLWIVRENDEKILRYLPSLRRLKCATRPLWDSLEKCRRYLALDYLTQLESLNISCLEGEFKSSDTINFPVNLNKLTLHDFRLSSKEMSMIGRLPKLEVLKLLCTSFDGKEWKTNDDEFQELKFLKLDGLKIHRWNTSSEHFPKLRQLIMHKCWKLKKFPSSFGNISTLQSIDIHSCRKSVSNSALQIQKEQLEMGNEELKVIISGSCW